MIFYKVSKAIAWVIFHLLYRIKVEGMENFPKTGPVIVCSNHTHWLDPFIVGITCPRPVHFMAKKELYQNKLVSKIIYLLGTFPVDREGNDIKALKQAINLLKSGHILGIFPEGTRVHQVDLQNMKAGIGLIALKAKADILPIQINTDYKLFGLVRFIIRKPIEIKNYAQLDSKSAVKAITEDTYHSMYDIH